MSAATAEQRVLPAGCPLPSRRAITLEICAQNLIIACEIECEGLTPVGRSADPSAPVAPARMMVVEDEALVRLAMAATLRQLNVAVIEAATADDGWMHLTNHGPPEVIFTDHRMPGSMSGAEFALRVTEHFPSVQVVVTSGGHAEVEAVWPGRIVRKPYSFVSTARLLCELAMAAR